MDLAIHGNRLSRVEAALESFINLSQSHELRLTDNESRFLRVKERRERIESDMERLSGNSVSLTAVVDRLEAIVENHINRHD